MTTNKPYSETTFFLSVCVSVWSLNSARTLKNLKKKQHFYPLEHDTQNLENGGNKINKKQECERSIHKKKREKQAKKNCSQAQKVFLLTKKKLSLRNLNTFGV